MEQAVIESRDLIYLAVALIAGCFAMIQLFNSRRVEFYKIKKDILEVLQGDFEEITSSHFELWDTAAWMLPVYKEHAEEDHNGHGEVGYVEKNNDALRKQIESIKKLRAARLRAITKLQSCGAKKMNILKFKKVYGLAFEAMPNLHKRTYKQDASTRYMKSINALDAALVEIMVDEMRQGFKGSFWDVFLVRLYTVLIFLIIAAYFYYVIYS